MLKFLIDARMISNVSLFTLRDTGEIRGKYLLRRIPHASHGSFNPYVITNKEAHIINGNMFGNVTKDKTRPISEQSQQTTKDRRHFMNYNVLLMQESSHT